MKLTSLYSGNKKDDLIVLRDYLEQLKKLRSYKKPLNEAKITITIDDDEKGTQISTQARDNFVEQAQNLGNFNDSDWVRQLINGMKQVGVQGFNDITEDEQPVTQKEMKHLIGMLVSLLNSK